MALQAKLKVNLRHDVMHQVGTVFTEPFPAFIQHEIDHCPEHVEVTTVVAVTTTPDDPAKDDSTKDDSTKTVKRK